MNEMKWKRLRMWKKRKRIWGGGGELRGERERERRKCETKRSRKKGDPYLGKVIWCTRAGLHICFNIY